MGANFFSEKRNPRNRKKIIQRILYVQYALMKCGFSQLILCHYRSFPPKKSNTNNNRSTFYFSLYKIKSKIHFFPFFLFILLWVVPAKLKWNNAKRQKISKFVHVYFFLIGIRITYTIRAYACIPFILRYDTPPLPVPEHFRFFHSYIYVYVCGKHHGLIVQSPSSENRYKWNPLITP